MRLMARDRAENEGRFGTGRPRVTPSTFTESGYSGLVLERLARHTCRIAGVDWSCLFVRDMADPRLVIAAAGHGVPWDLIGTRIGTDEGVVGQVLVSGKPAVLADYRALIGSTTVEDEVPRPGIAVPIVTGTSIGGVLCAAIVRYDRQFDEHDLELLAELAELAAAAIDHNRMRQHYDATVQAHVEALAAAMDMRDRRTASHSEDVVDLARQVGALLELEAASLLELEFAARLHDVGRSRSRRGAEQARPARSRGVRRHPLPRGVGSRRRSRASRASRPWPRSCASTTSAGTAPATPTG